MSIGSSDQMPVASALPARLMPSGPGNISGKSVRIDARHMAIAFRSSPRIDVGYTRHRSYPMRKLAMANLRIGYERCRVYPTSMRGDERKAIAMWRASILTLFPEMFPGPLGISLAGKALATGIWSLDPIDIRDHATDKHGTVDDTPAGGGPGMVMKADVLAKALDAIPPDPR